MQKENDSRFYLIQIVSISQLSSQFQNSNLLKLTFIIGNKKAQTKFHTQNCQVKTQDLSSIQDQTHIFSYEAEEVMNMILEDSNNNIEWHGLSNILITPFFQMPHTKHEVKVNMVFQHKDKSVKNHISAVVLINIYFFTKFKAKLQIQPLYANLIRDVAHIGQMQPYIVFEINQKNHITPIVQEGGIHPKWSNFNNVQNDHQDRYIFDLNSAGSKLKISLYSKRLIGNVKDYIGNETIKIQQYQLMSKPNQYIKHIDKNMIAIYYQLDNKKQLAGHLAIGVKFIFDLQKLIHSPSDI